MTEAGIWTLVSHDHFDRNAAPLVDARNLQFFDGIRLLWHRTLGERVLPGGKRGFVSFDLRCQADSIRIPDDFEALGRLRSWCLDAQGMVGRSAPLLDHVAAAHRWLYGNGRSAALILELVKRAHGADDCRRLLRLIHTE